MYIKKFGYPETCGGCAKKYVEEHIRKILPKKSDSMIKEYRSLLPSCFPYQEGALGHYLIKRKLKNKNLIDIYSIDKINVQNKIKNVLAENKEYLSKPKNAYVFMVFCNSFDPFSKGWEQKEIKIKESIDSFLEDKLNDKVASDVVNLIKKSKKPVFFIDNSGEDVALLNLAETLDKNIIIKAQHPYYNLWNDSNTKDVKRVLEDFNSKNVKIKPIYTFYYEPWVFSKTKCDLIHINGMFRNIWYFQFLEDINLNSSVIGSFLPKCEEIRKWLGINEVKPVIYYSNKPSREVICNLQ